jgi:metallo-beta-lactamase family protein
MFSGGRVVNYLKAILGIAHKDIVFVGYQTSGILGRDNLTYGPANVS